MRTGGGEPAGFGGVGYAALSWNMRGHRFGFFALTTRPVRTSSSAYARSPAKPRGPTSASESSSPSIDFTGYRQSPATAPTCDPVIDAAKTPAQMTLPTRGMSRPDGNEADAEEARP